ncbi:hypothetical protein TNIN_119501 [Trichonephila inaurata madagascariensis]|uniref:Uncharacterized protein n=1 Tax=Trichonephila inaurata madagascariensis TaxID=2747483 RepID=A0A8X6YM65_9ARAC|nr:hypothetical protein TNIN_119501 [Trichonephila inaurata madagascariensis]
MSQLKILIRARVPIGTFTRKFYLNNRKSRFILEVKMRRSTRLQYRDVVSYPAEEAANCLTLPSSFSSYFSSDNVNPGMREWFKCLRELLEFLFFVS